MYFTRPGAVDTTWVWELKKQVGRLFHSRLAEHFAIGAYPQIYVKKKVLNSQTKYFVVYNVTLY